MKKTFAILFFILCPLFMNAQTLSQGILDSIKKSTVFIEVVHTFPLSDEETSSTGSGFFISDNGFLVTNYHVIRPSLLLYSIYFPSPVKEINIIMNSGTPSYKKLKGYVYAVDKDNDLAIIGTKDKVQTPFINISDSAKAIETMPVWVFGFPYGEEFSVIQSGPEITINKGTLSALRHDDRGILNTLQIDAQVNPGNSGGPLINDKGKLLGIVNGMMSNATKMNFAVPQHYLLELASVMPQTLEIKDKISIDVTSEPSGASVFVDWKYKGKVPLKSLELDPGMHTFCLMKQGYTSWIEENTLSAEKKIDVKMQAVKSILINTIPEKPEDKNPKTLLPEDVVKKMISKNNPGVSTALLFEDFNNKQEFEKWEQNTGGDDKRTWFEEDGTLNQFESDEILHAISIGDSTWTDYIVSAKVKITDTHDDSRAGIIFRETPDGFYLFRIHKESKKAQLVYHSNNPFGWFVISEKDLGIDVADKWFHLAVCITGNLITCYFDSMLVFSAYADYSANGNTGFYSVESKASFDSLLVYPVSFVPPINKQNEKKQILSFWFSDYFDLESASWYQYSGNTGFPSAWFMSEAGCMTSDKSDTERTSEFTRFKISDFNMELVASIGKGNDTSSFSVFFRKNEKGMLSLNFNKKENKVKLISFLNNELKILKEEKLPENFFNNIHDFFIKADKESISINSSYDVLLEYKNKSLLSVPGTFGVSAKSLPVILHQLSVSSIKETDVKK